MKRTPWAAAALLMAACLTGCGGAAPSPARRAPSAATSPTAARLHDLCGSLLLFHGARRCMPVSLEELRRATGLQTSQVTDPATGRPFAYAAAGLALEGDGRRIVLYAAPAEGEAFRWCVLVADGGPMLQTEVAPIPIDRFNAAVRPAAGGGR